MVKCKCGCGCGGSPNKGKSFIHGHWSRTNAAKLKYIKHRKKVAGNPSKYCKCGCGGLAPIAKADSVSHGYRKGQRAFYIRGHSAKNKKGPESPRWKGGRRLNGYGYIEIYSPDHPHASKRDRYMQEHRLVMEKHLGRILDPEERVHHINGIRTDNRPENLVVISRSEHAKIHVEGLLEWKKKNKKTEKRRASKAGKKGAASRWGGEK